MSKLSQDEWQRIGLEHNQLLHDFIDSELKGFKEPQRKGISKGEKIGFSRKKTIAAILRGLTRLNLRQISDAIETTSSIVRYWNTERVFIQKAEDEKARFKQYLKGLQKAYKAQEETGNYEPLNLNILIDDKSAYSPEFADAIESVKQSVIGSDPYPKIFKEIEKNHKKDMKDMLIAIEKSINKNDFKMLDKLTRELVQKQSFLKVYHNMIDEIEKKQIASK